MRRAFSERIKKYKDFLKRNKENKSIIGHYGIDEGIHRPNSNIDERQEDLYFEKIGPRLTYTPEKSKIRHKKYRKLRKSRKLKSF